MTSSHHSTADTNSSAVPVLASSSAFLYTADSSANAPGSSSPPATFPRNAIQPISVACFDQSAWVRIQGRGSFQCSGALKDLIVILTQKGYQNYILDLIHCEQMDSTFMGTITGIAQRLRKEAQGTFRVINASKINQSLMENLGLDHLFLIQSLDIKTELPPVPDSSFFPPSALVEEPSNDKKKTQEVVLAAHQELVAIDQKNAEKFKDLVELMK